MTDPKNLNKCCPTNDGNIGKAIHSLSNRIQHLERINSDIENSIDDIQIILPDWNLSDSNAKDFIKNKPHALDGKSAYELAVDNGFEGTEQEWLASLKGEDGQLGLEGPAGQDGAPGRDGINGLNGAPGQDGHTPIITATKSNGVTTIKSDGTTIATINDGTNGLNGQDGAPGLNGLTPHIDSTNKHWIIGSTDTGIVAEGQNGSNGTNGSDGAPGQDGQDGQDGITPHIDPTTKHWMIGETDTNVLAEGVNGTNGIDGTNGITPHIDSTTGNWFIGITDTGVHALGPAGLDGSNGTNGSDGQDGHTTVITASKSNGVTTISVDGSAIATINDGQDGSDGTNGTNGTDGNDGTDGITPTVTVTSISNGHNVAFSYGTGDSRNTDFNVMDGNVANQLQADWNLTDNTQADYIKNKPDTSKFLQKPIDANGHTYVEIAGIRWATMNIGAESETDYGLYFQWADTQGYTYLQVASGQKLFGPGKDCVYIEYLNYDSTATKYNSTDNKTILDLSDDAVHANWGGSWRMPTRAECEALISAVNTSWTSNYNNSGIAGHICTDKTDSSKTLFFPAGGWATNLTYTTNSNNISAFETSCNYWTSDLDPEADHAALDFGGNHYGIGIGASAREAGLLIRGVLDINTDLLAKVAATGSYNDLTDKPTIPDISGKANSADLATVATSGDYNDLKNKPSFLSAILPENNNHTYVDLGLPSGTLWATMNVGASSETGFGNYYMYGKGSRQYNSSDSAYNGVENPLDLSVDTAKQVWGEDWRTPTKDLWNELLNNTTHYRTTVNGVDGYKFVAQNENYIFVPCAKSWSYGSYNDSDEVGKYWTSTPYDADYSYMMTVGEYGQFGLSYKNRILGYTIRGVLNNPITKFAKVWRGTQAQYDLLTPDNNTIYIITSAS